MSGVQEKINSIVNDSKSYLDSKIELTKLEIGESAAKIVAQTSLLFIGFCALILVILFLGLALAWYIGDICNSLTIGFLWTAGVFFLFFIMLWVLKNVAVLKPITNLLIRKMFYENENDETSDKRS